MKRTDRPRRMLTDWTASSGVAGEGLAALLVGLDQLGPEAYHLVTLGYEVFVLGVGEDQPHVHHVEVGPTELPEAWHRRFALVVSFDVAVVPHVAPCLADGGLLVTIGEADTWPGVEGMGDRLTEVVVEQGPDPEDPMTHRFRAVVARLADA
ncbi:MAG: hypothetical protein EON52_23280 [Actinomycetales bacterium]|nr:MAG: hypothetical protein EON52_23280 [Actinomycetales bacterium]